MKRIISLLFALFVTLSAQAQMEVSEFYLAETDLAAREEKDVDGELYSIIKIRTESPNLNLNEISARAWSQLGSKTVTKEQKGHVVEIWVYVRYGETGLKLFYRNSTKEIKFNNLQPGTKIGKGEVYIMNLRAVGDPDKPTQQWLVFNVTPQNAVVKLDGEPLATKQDGTASKFVSFGTYTYTVECKNYHPQSGSVTVGEKKETVRISLKPAFGNLRVEGNNGASVYIDNEMKGQTPLTLNELPSGDYSVMLVRDMYKSLIRTVTVRDEETTVFDESMEPNFATLTFTVEGGAEIWINGQKRGTGSVTGDFEAGTLTVETRKANHRNSAPQNIAVAANQKRTVALDPPTPIYGSLNIESEPGGAKIYIDGKYEDETPLFVSRILVGKHTVKMSKDGYADHVADINIEEGKTASHSATLNSTFPVQIACSVSGASLWIDGESRQFGTTYQLSAGKHTVKATKNGYKDFGGTIDVKANTNTQSFGVSLEAISQDRTFTVGGVSFVMKKVEGGTFTMGCTSEQGGDCDSDEKPTHRVTLSSYYIGETEVTQALWKAVMGSNPSNWTGDNLPVENVSWNDCQEFIRKLNQKTGQTFSLPTEAEWEYAARGGNKSKGYKYADGSNLNSVAWYTDNSGDRTHVVKAKQPNELGIYDMSGNVWEWCQDWYGEYSSASQTNPTGPASGSNRVRRGGSWFNHAWNCRVSNRDSRNPDYRHYYYGFRLVLH